MSKPLSENQQSSMKAKGFQPGNRANPGGRPKMKPELRMQAQEFTQEVLETWVECLRDPQARWADKIRAGELMMNRAWGMATQSVNVDISHTVSLTQALEQIRLKQLAQNEPPVIEAEIVETPRKD